MESQSGAIQVIEAQSQGVEVFEAQERASIDIQVNTAKRFPRDLSRVRNNSVAIVSMDKETAESCRYAKPQGGKNVTGPSVHLARIICQQYGNIRVQQRIKQITQTTIVAEAVAFDLETNYAVSVEARKSIVSKTGQRYPDHMIETSAMAILAIAERNAILKVIPKAITDSVYKAAFNVANGDLSDEQKLLTAKKKAFDFFQSKYGASEADVLAVLGLRSVGQVGAEQIADLRGIIQSLNDGELTADELFSKKKSEAVNPLADDTKEPKAEVAHKAQKKEPEPAEFKIPEEPVKKTEPFKNTLSKANAQDEKSQPKLL